MSKSTEETLRDKVERIELNGYLSTQERVEAVLHLLDQELERRVKEADKRTLETLAAILSGSGETVTGIQPQDEKRTIEIAQSYIRNKLSARHEEQK